MHQLLKWDTNWNANWDSNWMLIEKYIGWLINVQISLTSKRDANGMLTGCYWDVNQNVIGH